MKTSKLRLVAVIVLVAMVATLFAACGKTAEENFYTAKAQADELDDYMVSMLDKTLDPVFQQINTKDHYYESFFVDGMPVLQVSILTEDGKEMGYLIRGIPEMGPAVTVFRTAKGPEAQKVYDFLNTATAELKDGEIVLS